MPQRIVLPSTRRTSRDVCLTSLDSAEFGKCQRIALWAERFASQHPGRKEWIAFYKMASRLSQRTRRQDQRLGRICVRDQRLPNVPRQPLMRRTGSVRPHHNASSESMPATQTESCHGRLREWIRQDSAVTFRHQTSPHDFLHQPATLSSQRLGSDRFAEP